MPASKGSANNVLGKDFIGLSSKEIADAQAMNSGGNNQSDVDDLLVEECSSDGKENGSGRRSTCQSSEQPCWTSETPLPVI